MRATLLRPLGLITQPNEHGQYPEGALSRAHNVHLRDPGIVEVMQRPGVYRANAGGTNHVFRRMWAAQASLLVASDDGAGAYQLRWISDSASTLISIPEMSFAFSVGKIHAAQHRGRYYVTTDHGVIALASEGAGTAYLAGFPPPQKIDQDGAAVTTGAQAIADDKTAAWRAVFVRKGANGSYEKIGPPSHALQIDNTSGSTVDFNIKVGWPTVVSSNLQVGDYVELYRTETQDVGTSVGDDYLLSRAVALTSGDLTNGYVVILDSTPDAGLGAALYTNDEEEGATAAKYPPGLATDVAVFKGHAFYAASRVAGYHALRVPGTWGDLSTTAQLTHGIGTRTVGGDTTNGNPTITNVPNTTGIVAGQRIDDLGSGVLVPAGTTVVSKTSNSITMSANALSTQVGWTFKVYDIIEIDGALQLASHPYWMIQGMGSSINVGVQLNAPIHKAHGGSTIVNMEGVEATFTEPWYRYGSPTLRATNGQNYSPPLPALTETAQSGSTDLRLNRLQIAELDQPEAVPAGAGNELLVGAGEIYRLVSTTDALWVFCSDGLYRVSGEYPDWRCDPVDPTLVLAGRCCVDVLRGDVWAYTNRGLVYVTPGGLVQDASNPLISDQLSGAAFAETWNRAVVCDDKTREVHVVQLTDLGGGTFSTLAHVWNLTSRGWTTTDYARLTDLWSTAHTYVPYLREMAWGAVQTGSAADVIRTTTGAFAMAGAEVVFQPATGDGDPFTLKNWIDCTYILETQGSDYSILPSFNGEDFPASVRVLLPSVAAGKTTRGIAAIPTELGTEPVAMAASIAPGFTVDSDGASEIWAFKGLSLRWELASEESNARGA